MNNPDYCQAIYDAANKVVEFSNGRNVSLLGTVGYIVQLDVYIGNLKQALEGKEEKG